MNVQALAVNHNQFEMLTQTEDITVPESNQNTNVENQKSYKLEISKFDEAPTEKQKTFYTDEYIKNKRLSSGTNTPENIFPKIPTQNSMLSPVIEKLLSQKSAETIGTSKNDASFSSSAISEYLGMSLIVENSVNVGANLYKGQYVDKRI